jgi:hypothetical protein
MKSEGLLTMKEANAPVSHRASASYNISPREPIVRRRIYLSFYNTKYQYA